MTTDQQTQLAALKAAAFDAAQAIITAQAAWQVQVRANSTASQALMKAKSDAEKAVKDFEIANP